MPYHKTALIIPLLQKNHQKMPLINLAMCPYLAQPFWAPWLPWHLFLCPELELAGLCTKCPRVFFSFIEVCSWTQNGQLGTWSYWIEYCWETAHVQLEKREETGDSTMKVFTKHLHVFVGLP